MVWTLTKSGHFWTTYPPGLVNVVCERPLRPCHFEASEDTMTKSKLQALHVIRIKAGGIGNPPSLIAALWNIGILHQEHATCTKHFDVQCTFLFSFELNVTWEKLFVVSPRETWKKLGITWLHIFFNFSTLLNLSFIHDYYKTVDGAGGGLGRLYSPRESGVADNS